MLWCSYLSLQWTYPMQLDAYAPYATLNQGTTIRPEHWLGLKGAGLPVTFDLCHWILNLGIHFLLSHT